MMFSSAVPGEIRPPAPENLRKRRQMRRHLDDEVREILARVQVETSTANAGDNERTNMWMGWPLALKVELSTAAKDAEFYFRSRSSRPLTSAADSACPVIDFCRICFG
jgi:hypothetical protein